MILGHTGPSVYNQEIKSLVEDYFGATPLYVHQDKKDDLEWVLKNIDGLILSGGSDVFPGTYGQEVTYGDGLSKFDIRRDKRELFLIKECVKQGKPILSICRGLQILCLNFGFDLIPNISGTEIVHHPGDIRLNYEYGEFCHYVKILPEFKNKYKFESCGVNSQHHQCIPFRQIKEQNGINVVAVADTNTVEKKNLKIIEIIESEEMKIVGCQFHPEIDYLYGNIASNKVLERFKEFLLS